jgi:hypothetical protein
LFSYQPISAYVTWQNLKGWLLRIQRSILDHIFR